jgi:hypothetical protein
VNLYFPEYSCFKGNHIFLVCINCFVLFLTLLNSFYLNIFYEPSNTIENNNFGVSDNTYPYFLLLLGKFFLIFLNVFNFSNNQEVIKLCVFMGLMLLSIIIIARKNKKFLNLYQDILTVKLSYLFIFSLFVFLYSINNSEISLFILFLTVGSTIILSFLILHLIYYFRTNKLYAKVNSN